MSVVAADYQDVITYVNCFAADYQNVMMYVCCGCRLSKCHDVFLLCLQAIKISRCIFVVAAGYQNMLMYVAVDVIMYVDCGCRLSR